MDKEHIFLKVEIYIVVPFKMIKFMDLEHIIGKIVINIKDYLRII